MMLLLSHFLMPALIVGYPQAKNTVLDGVCYCFSQGESTLSLTPTVQSQSPQTIPIKLVSWVIEAQNLASVISKG